MDFDSEKKALIAELDRLKRAQRISKTGSWEFDFNSNLVHASEETRRIFGRENEVITLEMVMEFPLPEYRPLLDEKLKNLIEKDEEYNVEFQIRRKTDGEMIDIHSIATFDRERNCVTGTLQDITDRKKIERELAKSRIAIKENEENLRITLQSIGDAVISTDVSGNILRMNQVAENLTGWTVEEAAGKSLDEVFKIIHAHTREKVQSPFEKVMENGSIVGLANSTILVSKDGKERQIADSGSPILNPDGEIQGVVVVFRDVSQAYQTRLELQNSEIRYREMVESIPVGMVVYRPTEDGKDFIIQKFNRAAEKIEAISRDEVIGKRVTECFPGVEQFGLLNVFRQVLKTGKPQRHPVAFYEDDRISGWRENFVYLLPEGEICNVYSDETEKKIFETKLLETQSYLSQAISMAKMGYYLIALPSKKVETSSAFDRIVGIEPDSEKTIERWAGIIHPEDRERIVSELNENCFVRYDESMTEYRIIHQKTGEIIWVSAMGRLELNENNEPVFLFGFIQDITERKLMEEEVCKGRERYKSYMEYAPYGIFIADRSGRYVEVNPEACKQTGYSEEELLSKSVADLLAPEDLERGLKSFQKLVDTGQENTELRYLRADGEVCDWAVSAIRLSEDRYMGFKKDITQRKKAEIEMMEARIRFESLADLLPQSIWETDCEGYFTYVNLTGYLTSGYDRSEIESGSVNIFDMVAPEDRERAKKDLQQGVESGILPEDPRYTCLQKDGTTFTALIYGTPIEKSGEIVGIRGITLDISYQKKIEDALKESEERFQLAMEGTSDGLWDRNLLTNEAYFSESFFRMLGYAPNEIPASFDTWQELLHPEDKEEALKKLEDYLSQQEDQYESIFRLQKKNGDYIWILCRGKALFDENGNAVRLVGFNTDITQQKGMEAALLQSQRLQAVGEFASGVAHDFNNSLESILGNIEYLIISKQFDEETDEILDAMRNSVQDTAARIRKIQSFGQTDKAKKEYVPLNLNELIEEVLIQTTPIWKSNPERDGIPIGLMKNLKEVPQVFANPGELRSVLYNLIKNAVEAMPEGGDLSLSSSFENGRVLIRVGDCGKGMDEQTRCKIFDPFFTTKGFQVGRGLGLSGVYQVIQEHGGDICVEYSEIGRGSVFALSLPAMDLKPKEVLPEKIEKREADLLKILWVDDEKSIREIAQKKMEYIGQDVQMAESGEHALSLLQEKRFDLVITDIGMPEMNGWELADEIRKLYGDELLIAVLSGWGKELLSDDLKLHRVDYVLSKPLPMKELKSVLSEIQTRLS